MSPAIIWTVLEPGDGVLELDTPAFELHVVRDSETGAMAAWWLDEHGAWLRAVDVAEA